MTIRDATPVDLPAIVDIYNASVPGRLATADTEAVSVGSRREWFQAHAANFRRPLWVMEDGGQIGGWLSFSDYANSRPAYAHTAELSVYVAPAFQGQGVGRALCEEAVRRAPALGIKTLVSVVFAHNAPSLALCARLGFARWGFLPAVAALDGTERDVIILGLRITP